MKFKQSNTLLRNAALAGAVATLLAFSGTAGAAHTPQDSDALQTTGIIASVGAPASKIKMEEASARQDLLSLVAPAKPEMDQPVNTAIADSCASRWYWRSLIQELTCGFSGQGWYN
ncbi:MULTISPECIES: hypothetical protein [unclassified Variovorax]|uniref:hypothetical protein n=1 Tax=unclassified Variovorax TaxID=663243 RepID=UPI000F7D7F3C|nr:MULTISPECIES: hypothetical protein [unclassified Variovorax]RSZ37083.1 hypothetical protein EJO70_21915 [Variovorax sp. 553]RSZ37896.1 hypothetical protein EJO71_21910 [Variovorax sp. 679]